LHERNSHKESISMILVHPNVCCYHLFQLAIISPTQTDLPKLPKSSAGVCLFKLQNKERAYSPLDPESIIQMICTISEAAPQNKTPSVIEWPLLYTASMQKSCQSGSAWTGCRFAL